jgi:GNAT superfamily N-acetyltransferase
VRLAGAPLACGGLRGAADGTVEIKRMYVRPGARGGGIGRALLRALENEARRIGARRIALETGDAQEAAIAMYSRAGYREVPCSGGHERSRCFERVL